jgi:hypothetical protein
MVIARPPSCATEHRGDASLRAQLTKVSHKQAAIVPIGQSCIGFLIMPFSNTDLTAWHQLQAEPACYLADCKKFRTDAQACQCNPVDGIPIFERQIFQEFNGDGRRPGCSD